MARNPLRGKESLDLIPERRPSVTNSAWASYRLEQMGLGVEPIGKVLQKALVAKLRVYSKDGEMVDERPDYRTQLEAARMLKEIHGFTHVPEQKVDVPLIFVQYVQELRNKPLAELEAEAQRFLPRNRVENAD